MSYVILTDEPRDRGRGIIGRGNSNEAAMINTILILLVRAAEREAGCEAAQGRRYEAAGV